MKVIILSSCSAFAFVSLACAGPGQSAGKEFEQTAACPQWFADTEWNVGLWGTYAFTDSEIHDGQNRFSPNPELTRGYLNTDDAWGGGLYAKYFFRRYFGLGVEGYVLAADGLVVDETGSAILPQVFIRHERRAVGSALGTFTFRYPIPCTRFAPYAYAGMGAIFGGGEQSIKHAGGGLNTQFVFTTHTGNRMEPVGEFGGGVEFRLTPHIGITNDFSWNLLNGRNNNFGMVRSGLNLAF